MARKVLKYGPLEVSNEDPQIIHMPKKASILNVGSKTRGFIDIWVIVDEDETDDTRPRTFQIFATGAPLPEDAMYVDTSVQDYLHNGSRVFHLFERLVD